MTDGKIKVARAERCWPDGELAKMRAPKPEPLREKNGNPPRPDLQRVVDEFEARERAGDEEEKT